MYIIASRLFGSVAEVHEKAEFLQEATVQQMDSGSIPTRQFILRAIRVRIDCIISETHFMTMLRHAYLSDTFRELLALIFNFSINGSSCKVTV